LPRQELLLRHDVEQYQETLRGIKEKRATFERKALASSKSKKAATTKASVSKAVVFKDMVRNIKGS
jgi:hypothetical protein